MMNGRRRPNREPENRSMMGPQNTLNDHGKYATPRAAPCY